MTRSKIAGKVQTVLGPVEPDSLGPTTTHEHLLIDFRVMYREPAVPPPEDMAHQEITLQNRGWIHYNHYSSYFNLLLDDVDLATDEVRLFKQAGGGAIVDVTTIGIGRDPAGLARVSSGSGVPIVMGAGFYVDAVHPEDMDLRSEEDLARKIIEDIRRGRRRRRSTRRDHRRSRLHLAPDRQRAKVAQGIGSRPARDRRSHPHSPRTATIRSAGDYRDSLRGRSRRQPRHHGTPRPHHREVRDPRRSRGHRMLPGVGPLRQRVEPLPAVPRGHALGRTAHGHDRARRQRAGMRRPHRSRPRHLHTSQARQVRRTRLRPHLPKHRPQAADTRFDAQVQARRPNSNLRLAPGPP